MLRSYTTIGDNNNGIADLHVISDGDIIGKYSGRIPGAGKIMDFLSGSVGFLVVIVLPMLLFFIYQVYNLIMISIRLKKTVAVEEAAQAKRSFGRSGQERGGSGTGGSQKDERGGRGAPCKGSERAGGGKGSKRRRGSSELGGQSCE